MKTKIITGLLILFALFANAQETGTKYNDTVAPPPTPPPPPQTKRTTNVHDPKLKSDNEINAEKQAKDKGSNKKQTRVNPEKIPPIVDDTIQQGEKIKK